MWRWCKSWLLLGYALLAYHPGIRAFTVSSEEEGAQKEGSNEALEILDRYAQVLSNGAEGLDRFKRDANDGGVR